MSLKPQNDFKAFSISNNANVVSQERYEESRSLKNGFPPDNVTTHELNKVLRQSSTISSVVANFIATHSGGDDVLDDGDIAKLTAQLNSALEKKITTEIPNTSLTQKGIVQLTNKTGDSNTLAVTQKLASDINDNANNKLAKDQNGADIPDKNEFVKNLGLKETIDSMEKSIDWKIYPGQFGIGSSNGMIVPDGDYNNAIISGVYAGPGSAAKNGVGNTPYGPCFVMARVPDHILQQAYYKNQFYYRYREYGKWGDWYYVMTSDQWTVDANGFYKKASPVINIWNNKFETNNESKGATVEYLSEGLYIIKGVLGFNADAMWGGVDGGIEIPLCKNKLPLIWVDYEVLPDGTIKLMTYHREHPDAPVFARNAREGYTNGDLIDIPPGRFVSVRVQMPGADDEKLSI